MQRTLFLAAFITLAGCNARWLPWATPPGCCLGVPSQSLDGELGRLIEGKIRSDTCLAGVGVKYQVPTKGVITAAAEGSPYEAPIHLAVFQDGNVPLATANSVPGLDTRLVAEVEPGDLYVVVAEPWKTAVDLPFLLLVTITPAAGP